jgi:hypothetical protein
MLLNLTLQILSRIDFRPTDTHVHTHFLNFKEDALLSDHSIFFCDTCIL